MRRMILLGAALTAVMAVDLRADLVVLTNGRTMKVVSYEVTEDQDQVDLHFRTGGHIRLPILQVDRILDDEVIEQHVVEEVPVVTARVFPDRSWRYDDQIGPLFPTAHNAAIIQAACKFDVDAALVSAVIKAESNYRTRAVSRKGARGLMQLMPSTATRFGVTNSFDPVANIYGGTRYLRWLLDTFDGNADFAVAAYNAGEGNVWKYDGVPPFRETREYIRRVASYVTAAATSGSSAGSIASVASGR